MKYIITACFMLILLAALTACTGTKTSPATPSTIISSSSSAVSNSPATVLTPDTITPDVQKIIAQTISAMSKVNSFRSDSDIIEADNHSANNSSIQTSYEWIGTRSISITDNTMQIDMTVNTDTSNINPGFDSMAFETYFSQRWGYFNITVPESDSGWHKTLVNSPWWNEEFQNPELIQILNTAQGANLSGSEMFAGTDCWVLTVTPTTQATSNWISSQHSIADWVTDVYQSVRPGKVSAVPPSLTYDQTSEKSKFIFWISKVDSLILRIEVNDLFEGTLDDTLTGSSTPTASGENYSSQTTGWTDFFDYNQPFIIVMPTAALYAPEQPTIMPGM